MRQSTLLLVAVTASLGVGAFICPPVRAQDQATANDPVPVVHEPAHHEAPGVEDESLDHRMQVGIRVGAGMPYTFAIRYADGARCDAAGEDFCHDFGTPLLDVGLDFGITDAAELTLSGRFGLTQSDVSGSNPIQIGLGIRGYGSPMGAFKVYFGGRVVLDLTQSSVPNWSDVDLGVRGEFGLQYDFIRYLGAYAQLGASLAFIRAFSVTVDLTGGLQVRFP